MLIANGVSVSDNDAMRFGDAVKRLREARDLSQEQLAAIAGFSRATMQNIETADTDTLQGGTRRKLAAALGISTDELKASWQGEVIKVELPADLVAQIEARATLAQKTMAEWLRGLLDKTDSLHTKKGKKSAADLKLLHAKTSQKSSPSEEASDGSTAATSH